MKGMAAIYTHSLQGDFKRRVRRWSSPRAALVISACGVGNLRVRRWQSPRAAFEFPLRGIHCYLSLTGSAP